MPNINPPQLNKVKQLIAQKRLIEAIKAYREATGAGLKEAKAAVEALASGEHSASTVSLPTGSQNAPNMQAIKTLVQEGKKIEAVKVVREVTGTGLKEAKEAVAALEQVSDSFASPLPPIETSPPPIIPTLTNSPNSTAPTFGVGASTTTATHETVSPLNGCAITIGGFILLIALGSIVLYFLTQ